MALGNGTSDLFKLVALLGAYDYEGSNPDFCAKNFVRPKVSLTSGRLVHFLLSSLNRR